MTASVVQCKTNGQPNGTSPWVPTLTLSSTPTQGNLLYAIVFYRSATAPVAASGWTLDQSASYTINAPATQAASYWKYAGASEPTTITPNTTSGVSGSIIVFEVTNVPPTFAAAKIVGTIYPSIAQNPTTSGGYNGLGSSQNNTLFIDGFFCYSASGAGVGTVGLSPSTMLSSYNAVGGTSNVTITAAGGSFLQASPGTYGDNINLTVAADIGWVAIGLASAYVPANTQGSSKINAWAMTGPTNNTQVVSKVTGYVMVGPPPASPGWISVME